MFIKGGDGPHHTLLINLEIVGCRTTDDLRGQLAALVYQEHKAVD